MPDSRICEPKHICIYTSPKFNIHTKIDGYEKRASPASKYGVIFGIYVKFRRGSVLILLVRIASGEAKSHPDLSAASAGFPPPCWNDAGCWNEVS